MIQGQPRQKGRDPTWKINKSKNSWWRGSRAREPAKQAWGPEFKSQYSQTNSEPKPID
jgi:hypothetical protein